MFYTFFKRVLDISLAIIALILVSPLSIPIAIILRSTAEGYIFYRQQRIGRYNKKFKIWKFATMLKDSPKIGTGSLTLRNDPRVTPFGRYLRITKLNELPQLVNVLRGEMSVVGPRPQMQVDFEAYPPHIQEKIYNVRPGITGIGSIIFRDEEALISKVEADPHTYYREVIAPYKGELELWYQRKQSLLVDLILIFLTFWVIFFPRSEVYYKLFRTLPVCPEEIRRYKK